MRSVSHAHTRKLGFVVAFLLLQLATFMAVNLTHFNFFRVSVVLYACVMDILIASILTVAIWQGVLARWFPLEFMELFLSTVVGILALLIYSIMGPTVIDRSLSIYIIEKLDRRGGEIAEAAFPEVLKKEFFQEYNVVDVRLTEQVTSGTANITDGCIRLTPRGKFVASFTRFYRKHFLPKKRVIMGTVTDKLTDPLKESPVLVPYACPGTDED